MNRVMVIGGCGAGKSTLSFELAERLNLPVFHLDQLFWRPGWVQADKNEWIARHREIIDRPRWLIDGNYASTMDERLEQADLIVWLDMPRWRCILGILKRRWQYRGRTRPDMNEGCRERINWEFLKYVWNFHRDNRPELLKKLKTFQGRKTIHILTNRKQVDRFLEQVNP